jgi:hypothetical protein
MKATFILQEKTVKPFFKEPGNGFLHPFLHIPGHRAQ